MNKFLIIVLTLFMDTASADKYFVRRDDDQARGLEVDSNAAKSSNTAKSSKAIPCT
jgi:hypothetical protein